MISHFIELIIDGVITIFMKQRWYFAVLYTFAFLSLIAGCLLGLLYVASSWIFAPDRFVSNVLITVGGTFAAILLWWGFIAITRKTAV